MAKENTILNEMRAEGLLPNLVTYNVMIDGHCYKGNIVKSFKLRDEIQWDSILS